MKTNIFLKSVTKGKKPMKKIVTSCFLCLVLILAAASLCAQETNEELAQAAANPLADLISIPVQNNLDFGLGEYNRSRNVLNFQPVIPLAGGKIITRTILPVVWIPDISSESGSLSSGLSDTTFTAFYVPPTKGNLTWGPGVALDIPTGGEMRGSQKWSIGPSVVVLAQPGPWTLGILANTVWSFAGNSDRHAVNKGFLQYFIVRQLGNGLYVNSAPIITANWKAPEGQKWVVPFGAGIGKLFRVGKLPINAQVGAYYNLVKPDVGPKWQFRIQVQFILPMSILKGN
jgi:hypothetical protein